VHPKLLKKLDFTGLTTLKGIEPHRLRVLILRDLEIYEEASISEIHQRIGLEIPRRRVRSSIQELLDERQIMKKGENRWRKYLLAKSAVIRD